MELRIALLGAFLGLQPTVALASRRGFAPGIVPLRPSYQNTTQVVQPTPTASECDSKCSVLYPKISALQWVPEAKVVYTTTYTVATVQIQFATSFNSTYTQSVTIFNDPLPEDYNSWTLNPNFESTTVVTFPITRTDGTFFSRVAYPTPWLDYDWEYHWQGILQTHNKEFTPTCATVAPPDAANVPLPTDHPEYPQPTGPLGPGRADPFGAGFVPVWAPYKDEPDERFFNVAFPSESAFSYCEPMSHTDPLPSLYTTAKYVTATVTLSGNFSANGTFTFPVPSPSKTVAIIQPTATGWENTSDKPGGVEKTATGFETTPGFGGKGATSAAVIRIESSVPGLGQAHQTDAPEPGPPGNPPSLPNIIASIIKNNPGFFSLGNQGQQGGPTPAPGQFAVAPTPTFTFVPTVINGQSTSIPAFILPSSGATATIGQSITINGIPTILSPPSAIFTSVSTTINGVPTVIPAYIISGTSTATLGQTIVLNGQTTVQAAPTAVLTWVPTIVNGISTSILVYETPGPSAAPTGGTTLNSSAPAGTKTSNTDSAMSSAARSPGPATTTKPAKGAATEIWMVSRNAVLVGLGALALVWL